MHLQAQTRRSRSRQSAAALAGRPPAADAEAERARAKRIDVPASSISARAPASQRVAHDPSLTLSATDLRLASPSPARRTSCPSGPRRRAALLGPRNNACIPALPLAACLTRCPFFTAPVRRRLGMGRRRRCRRWASGRHAAAGASPGYTCPPSHQPDDFIAADKSTPSAPAIRPCARRAPCAGRVSPVARTSISRHPADQVAMACDFPRPHRFHVWLLCCRPGVSSPQ